MTATAARRLLAEVRDDGWFFDTELLVLAQRSGLRIHEVPVDWVDDPDSRVDIVSTAIEDLRGVARLAAAGPVARFMGVGVLSTIAYVALYLLLHGMLGAGGANAVALALTAVANTAANRRLTFGVRGRERLLHHHARGAVVYVLTLGLTTLALASLHRIDPSPPRAASSWRCSSSPARRRPSPATWPCARGSSRRHGRQRAAAAQASC